MRNKPKRFLKWLDKLRKDGVRKRFLTWTIPLILPYYHLQRNSPGRKKKVESVDMNEVQQIVEGMGKDDPISREYRADHSQEKWPGRRSGD